MINGKQPEAGEAEKLIPGRGLTRTEFVMTELQPRLSPAVSLTVYVPAFR